jgi:hypothetical protein
LSDGTLSRLSAKRMGSIGIKDEHAGIIERDFFVLAAGFAAGVGDLAGFDRQSNQLLTQCKLICPASASLTAFFVVFAGTLVDLLVPLLHDVTRTEVEGFSRRGGFGGFRPRQTAHGKKAGNWGIPGKGGSGCPQNEAH